MFKYIIVIFLIGMLFRMLSKYILPFFRIASATHSRLKEMQEKMQEMDRKVNNNSIPKNKGKKEGDYIEYEEVR